MAISLSVNLNKVALLRNSRGATNPSPEVAGAACLDAGAYGLTLHWRHDNRHYPARRRCSDRTICGARYWIMGELVTSCGLCWLKHAFSGCFGGTKRCGSAARWSRGCTTACCASDDSGSGRLSVEQRELAWRSTRGSRHRLALGREIEMGEDLVDH